MKPGTQTVSRSLTFRHAALLFLIAVVTLPGLGSRWTANGAQQSKQPQSRTSLPAQTAVQTAVPAASQEAMPTTQQAQLLISMLLLKGEQESISALIEESSNSSATLRQLSDIPVVFDRSENHLLMQILNGLQQPPADLQVISRPRLRVFSGSSGTIQIGQQVATDGDGPGANAEFHGLSVDVTPSLTSDQKVDVNLSMKLSEPVGASQIALISTNGDVAKTFTQPQTRLIKVSTNFSMLTNQAALIRGRSEKTPEVKGEILLMMHVEVVDENHPADQPERPESGVDEAAQMTMRYYAISDIEVAAGQRINGDSKTGDYTPLLEFIRSATGGARTWGKPFSNESGGTMMIDENSQALIVRQTAAVHDQIAALLRTLRTPEEQIVVQCTVFTVPSTSTSVAPWMDQNLKFQFPIYGRPWAQLTPEQSTQFQTALTSDSSVSQLLTPRLTVFSRQSAMIQTQTPNRIGPGSFSMTVQPTIHGDEVIELSHRVVVGNEDPESAKTQSALVLDGQLLIVQLDRSPGERSSTSQPDAADQRSYLMLQAIRKSPEAEEELQRPTIATPE